MAAVSRMSNPERVVITAVLAGVLRIDDQGRVWRNTKRGEVRAEKKLPNGYLQVRWMTGGRLLDGRTHDGFPATQDAKEANG